MVTLTVDIWEVEKGSTQTQTFCAKTKLDHLPENDIVAYGETPEDALEAWVEEIKEKEVFRPD